MRVKLGEGEKSNLLAVGLLAILLLQPGAVRAEEYIATADKDGGKGTNTSNIGSMWVTGAAGGGWGYRSNGGFSNGGILYATGAGNMLFSPNTLSGGGLWTDGVFNNLGTVYTLGGVSSSSLPAGAGIYARRGVVNTGALYAQGGYGYDSFGNFGFGLHSEGDFVNKGFILAIGGTYISSSGIHTGEDAVFRNTGVVEAVGDQAYGISMKTFENSGLVYATGGITGKSFNNLAAGGTTLNGVAVANFINEGALVAASSDSVSASVNVSNNITFAPGSYYYTLYGTVNGTNSIQPGAYLRSLEATSLKVGDPVYSGTILSSGDSSHFTIGPSITLDYTGTTGTGIKVERTAYPSQHLDKNTGELFGAIEKELAGRTITIADKKEILLALVHSPLDHQASAQEIQSAANNIGKQVLDVDMATTPLGAVIKAEALRKDFYGTLALLAKHNKATKPSAQAGRIQMDLNGYDFTVPEKNIGIINKNLDELFKDGIRISGNDTYINGDSAKWAEYIASYQGRLLGCLKRRQEYRGRRKAVSNSTKAAGGILKEEDYYIFRQRADKECIFGGQHK